MIPVLVLGNRFATVMFFNRTFRRGTETVDDWIRDLERWAARCGFGTYLDSALIGQLIRGVGDEQLTQDLARDDTL